MVLLIGVGWCANIYEMVTQYFRAMLYVLQHMMVLVGEICNNRAGNMDFFVLAMCKIVLDDFGKLGGNRVYMQEIYAIEIDKLVHGDIDVGNTAQIWMLG